MQSPRTGADELRRVGRLGRSHGVRGEVKLIPETADPELFGEVETVFVGDDERSARPWRVESAREQHSSKGLTVLLKMEGIASPEEAERLRGLAVFVREAELPEAEEDDFSLDELPGLAVVTEAGEPVGRVREVLELPAQDVLVVERPGAPEAMIPVVPEFVVEVDPEAGRVVVRLIEGLLE